MMLAVILSIAIAAGLALLVGYLYAHRRRPAARKRRPTSLALASLMFGFGSMVDPSTRHVVEARTAEAEDEDSGGDPPET